MLCTDVAPSPLEPRPIRQTRRPTGFEWGTSTPDPDTPPEPDEAES